MKTQFFSDPPEGQVRLRDLRPLAYRGKSGFLGSHFKTDSRKCSLFLTQKHKEKTRFGGIPVAFLGCVLDRITQKSTNLLSKFAFFDKNMQAYSIN